MSKQTKQHFENIELIDTPDTAFFEVKMVVAMEQDEDGAWLSAGEWLQNILWLAGDNQTVAPAAKAFMASIANISERRVHLCSVERIEG
jgi:hypothetical protein